MKPPLCYVCGADGLQEPGQFTVVYFALTPAEEAFAAERSAAGWVGHPDNAVWFCEQHVALGRERAGMHWRAALAELR